MSTSSSNENNANGMKHKRQAKGRMQRRLQHIASDIENAKYLMNRAIDQKDHGGVIKYQDQIIQLKETRRQIYQANAIKKGNQ